MPESRATGFPLLEHILEIARQAHMSSVSVAVYDFAADAQFSYRASRVFHAASTIKLAILFALLRAAETGRVRLTDRFHVRNRFRSQADGTPFFLQADRDGDPDLYKLRRPHRQPPVARRDDDRAQQQPRHEPAGRTPGHPVHHRRARRGQPGRTALRARGGGRGRPRKGHQQPGDGGSAPALLPPDARGQDSPSGRARPLLSTSCSSSASTA